MSKKIDIREILQTEKPELYNKYPKFIRNVIIATLNNFLNIDEINQFLEMKSDKKSLDFVDALFDYFNISYILSTEDKKKIPSEGRLIIVANHPLGGLDGLALIQAVSEVRNDIRIVANDLLVNLENMSELFLTFNENSFKKKKEHLRDIEKALEEEQAVILFPAGSVSRLTTSGIKDLRWKNGAVKLSKKLNVPILPVYIYGRNSLRFYLYSLLNSNLGTLMLPKELLRMQNKSISMKIGDVIPGHTFKNSNLNNKVQTKLLFKHIYTIKNDNRGIFQTEKTIIHPIDKKILKLELKNSSMLGYTKDGKKIYVTEYSTAPNILKEIARLREITFRKVGEGTGKTMDIDEYDLYYKHIVLWDEDELEIVGSYRLGITKEILTTHGVKGLYNASLFDLSDRFIDIVEDSLEVGRSFVQQKYWGSNALDYIWQGIGAYLSNKPNINYLWGAVSLSDSYSEIAKALIISYYEKWYLGDMSLVKPMNKYVVSKKYTEEIEQILSGTNVEEDFKNLKNALKNLGLSVPVLYRRYCDITEYGGSLFVSWSTDYNFNNAIDGLIMVDLTMLKDDVKKRYYNQKSFVNSSIKETGELVLS